MRVSANGDGGIRAVHPASVTKMVTPTSGPHSPQLTTGEGK